MNSFVLNVTRGYYMRRKQAMRGIENCACAWVKFGETVRDLTLVEAIAARNVQAAMREPLPFAELPGLMYRPAVGQEQGARVQRSMCKEANRFVELGLQVG